jgi:hypothetical protein
MKKLLVMILCAGFAINATAQEKDSVTLKPKWNIGETLVYTMVTNNIHKNQNQFALSVDVDTQYLFLKAVKFQNNEYKVLLNYRKTPDFKDRSYKFVQLEKNYQYVLRMDTMGNVLGLENWKEFRYKYQQSIDSLLLQNVIDSVQYKKMSFFYSYQDNIETIALNEIRKFLAPYSDGFRIDNKYLIKRHLENPFGGRLLTVQGTTILTKPLGSKYILVINNKSGTEQDVHQMQLEKDYKAFKAKRGIQVEKMVPIFYIGNTETFHFNTAQGRLTYAAIKDSIVTEIESRNYDTYYRLTNVIEADKSK